MEIKEILSKLLEGQTKMDKRLSSVEKHISSVEKNVSSMDKRLSSVEKNVSSMDKRLSSVEKNVSSMDKRLSSVEDKVQNIETQQKENTQRLKAVFEQTAKLSEFRTETIDKLDDIRKEIEFVSLKEHENEKEIYKLKMKVK